MDTVLLNLTGNSSPGAVYSTANSLAQGTWPPVYFLTLQTMTIIQNPPGLAAPLEPLPFPASCRGSPCMPEIPTVLGGLYIELPCHFVFWYLEPYDWLRPWLYLMILALYTCYLTSPDASCISLRWSVIVQLQLEWSLTAGIYRVK